LDIDTRFRLLRTLENDPEITQRDLARELDLSLGKTHYCLRALVEKGWVKINRFRQSKHKHRYLYKLTPSGIAEKTRITRQFLQRKVKEHQALTDEIENLRHELKEIPP
jgi:EPS-associated MarR family transcriptional regulator